MSKNNILSKDQQEEIKKLVDEITNEAKKVVDDYTKNPSNMSGSIIEVHENSPHLKKNKD
tara:strand:+ start:649 stop:828 length:180 start_codon:yes stop_codon:yes gene_type:complete